MVSLLGGGLAEASALCFPAGVAEPSLTIGYVAQANGITAIALESGKPLWVSEAANVPLIATADRLAATAYGQGKPGFFTVAILDRQTGKLLAQTEPVPITAPASPSPERPDIAASVANGQLRLTWLTRPRYRGGAPPPAQRAYTPPQETLHSVVVDLSTARIVDRQDSPKAAAPETAAPAAPRSVAHLRGGEWTRGPWPVADGQADFVQTGAAAKLQVSLEIVDASTKKVRKTVPLGTGRAAQVTEDGLYLLAEGADRTWRVIRTSTGDEAGRATLDVAVRDICVHEPRLYYLNSRATAKGSETVLCTVDLRTGRPVWELSLGERQFPGKPPRLPQ